MRILLTIASLLGLAACSPDPEATMGVDFDAQGAYAQPGRYRAEIRQGSSVRIVTGAQLTVTQQSAERFVGHRDAMALGAGESVTVTITLALGDGGRLTLPVKWVPEKDVDYGVGTVIATHRPQGFCFAVEHAEALPPLGAASGDSVFVLRSGLARGAVC